MGIGARLVPHGLGNGAYVFGRRAAAAANHIEQSLLCETPDLRRHGFGAFVILAEFIGQAGIGIGTDKCIRDTRDLGQMRAHGLGAERAIQSNGEGLGVAERIPEGGRRLAGQGCVRKGR